jgi:hypothetical protein
MEKCARTLSPSALFRNIYGITDDGVKISVNKVGLLVEILNLDPENTNRTMTFVITH